jgi:hypothetical protein
MSKTIATQRRLLSDIIASDVEGNRLDKDKINAQKCGRRITEHGQKFRRIGNDVKCINLI